MEQWLRISLLVCIFGFVHEFRPSEPFVIEFLTGEWRNITSEQLNKEVYPIGTYSVFVLTIIALLITDILRYKPIIIVSAIAGVIKFSILLWTTSLLALQICQVFYATFTAMTLAYYTYIYAKVDREHYQLVTANTFTATLCGKLFGSTLAQILISTQTLNYRQLNYISFVGQIISLIVAILLPTVHKSIYFHDNESDALANNTETASNEVQHDKDADAAKSSWQQAIRMLSTQFVTAFTNIEVVQLILWWTFANSGFIQVASFIQFLWKDIVVNHERVYNGGVEAVLTVFCSAGTMAAGFTNKDLLKRFQNAILTICAILLGTILIILATTNDIWVAYVMYVLFGAIYFYVVTLVSSTVAQYLPDDSFALIFGIIALTSSLLQVFLTFIFVSETGFGLNPQQQYYSYGGYFISIAIFYLIFISVRSLCERNLCCCSNESRAHILKTN